VHNKQTGNNCFKGVITGYRGVETAKKIKIIEPTKQNADSFIIHLTQIPTPLPIFTSIKRPHV